LAGLILTSWAGFRLSPLYQVEHPRVPRLVFIAIHIAFTVLFTKWGLATWRRFARYDVDDPQAAISNGLGARGFGVLFAFGMSAMEGARRAGPFSATFANLERLLYFFLFSFLVFLPIGLWAGYLWGYSMAWVFAPRARR
jgi:hypothetical protein